MCLYLYLSHVNNISDPSNCYGSMEVWFHCKLNFTVNLDNGHTSSQQYHQTLKNLIKKKTGKNLKYDAIVVEIWGGHSFLQLWGIK